MSLQVWLPLNGNLNNQGLANVTITNNGATVNDNGKIGKCYYFNGSSYIKISLPSSITSLKNTTICMWIKGNQAFGGISHDGNADVPCMSCFSSWQFTNGSTWQYISGGSTTDGKWHHVACTMDDTTIRTYIDGSLVTTNSISSLGIITDLTSSNFIELGCDHPGGDEYLTGYINDFRVYDHCLSAKEVKEISKGLVCHYKLSGAGGENLCSNCHLPTLTEAAGTSVYTYEIVDDYGECTKITCTKSGSGGRYYYPFPKSSDKFGKTYTWSIDIKASRSFNIDIGHECGGLKTISLSSEWKRYSHTWTFTNSDYHAFIVYPQENASVGDWIEVRNLKIEEGSKATPWCPNPSDALYSTLGYNDEIEYDCSGYGNNGTKVGDIAWSGDSPRYSGSYMLTTGSSYIYTTLNTSGYANSYTFSYWAKINDMSGKMAFGFGDGNRLNLYPTNSIFCWNTGDSGDNPFQNNGSNITFTPYNGGWHHYTITGDGTTTTLYIDGEKKGTAKTYRAITGTKLFLSGWNTTDYKWTGGNISDFRLYSTCLSAEDVKELYNTAASVANNGSLYAYEFEDIYPNVSLGKNGIYKGIPNEFALLCQYDTNIYEESDGSLWVRITHHNNPASKLFDSTDNFNDGVYKDEDRWAHCGLCNKLSSFEFMVKQKNSDTSEECKYRWIQKHNPLTAVYEDVAPNSGNITHINTSDYLSSDYGGVYHSGGNSFFIIANKIKGNWFGAIGCWTAYQGGIPGYPESVVTTGYIDLYVRIDNQPNDMFSITSKGLLASQFIEI